MNNKQNSRKGFTRMYNPKQEGIGAYDMHYINAYKKRKRLETLPKSNTSERQAA